MNGQSIPAPADAQGPPLGRTEPDRRRAVGVATLLYSRPMTHRQSKDSTPSPPAQVVVEVCVDDASGVRAARDGGAHRIELTSSLGEGGLTPSRGLLDWASEGNAEDLAVMIRPRRGDFVYDDDDLEVMGRDIDAARNAGAAAVVLGVLRPDGAVDAVRTHALVERARPLEVTFHRAFDLSRDLREALDVLIEIGVERVLTSGGAASALEGAKTIRDLVGHARDRITILAGGGVRPANARQLVEETGVREIHLSASRIRTSTLRPGRSVPLSGDPLGDQEIRETDEELVRATIAATRSRD